MDTSHNSSTIKSIKTNFIKFVNSNSFIIISTIILFVSIALYYGLGHIRAVLIGSLTLQFINLILSIICWQRMVSSPYRTALTILNVLVLIILLLFAVYADFKIDMKGLFNDRLHLDVWDWVAFILGFITLIFAACTWSSQEKTQKNTLQITPDGQYLILSDSVRDSYRNISLAYALDFKMQGLYGQYYPSDEMILRMSSDVNSIFPSLFADRGEKCCSLQRYRVCIKNANTELQVIASQFGNENIKSELLQDNVRLLENRLDNNLGRLNRLLKELWNYDEEKAAILRKYIISKAADWNDNNPDYTRLFLEAEEKFDNGELQYFYNRLNKDGKRKAFLQLLFPTPNEVEEEKFVRKLNLNIYADAHLFGRIRLIPYDSSKPLILD